MSTDDTDEQERPHVRREYREAADERINELIQELARKPLMQGTTTELDETPPPPGRSFAETIEATGKRIAQEDAARRALPCFAAMYPSGVPDGYLDASREHAEVLRGARGCDAAKAETGCPHRTSERICAQRQLGEVVERTRMHLRKAGVEDHEYGLVMAAAMGAQPLMDTDALRVTRAFLRRARQEVQLENGSEIDPLTGKATLRRVTFTGSERLLVIGGATGRGKTLAASYAIGRAGGCYLTEYVLARPREADVPGLKGVPGVLVVDQLGRAVLDERRTSALLLEEIVDRRYAARLDTVLVPNMTFEQFSGRYGAILRDRAAGHGVYVDLAGPSLRPATKGSR